MRAMAPGAPGETIGQRLRRLRLEGGFSQRELSSPGVSYAYISRIEAGSRQPSVKAMRMLARKLGVTPDFLETGSDLRDAEARELRLGHAELELRLGGDTDSAERTLREVVAEAVDAGDRTGAARARAGLGLAAAGDGRTSDAVELIEQALADAPLLPATRPDVCGALGRAHAALGHPERAVELFERCIDSLPAAAAPDDIAARVRFSTYLSLALADAGDAARARSTLAEALDGAASFTDPYARVRLLRSLGHSAARRHDSAAALDYVRRAIALLESTEDTLHLGRAHITHARTLLGEGRADEAGTHLETAGQLFGPHPPPGDLASLRTEQARCAVMLGDGAEAARRARESLALLDDDVPAERGFAYLALAEGLVLADDLDGALLAYADSAARLESAGRRQEAAQTCRAWARVLRRSGREAEALDVLERATDLAVSGTPAA